MCRGVIRKLKVSVLVDDYLSERGARRGALPVHGLGVYAECVMEDGRRVSVLIDGGPLLEVLQHNAEVLGADLHAARAFIASMWSAHHVAALLRFAQGSYASKVYLPPLPKQRPPGRQALPDLGAVLLPLRSPVYNERAVLLKIGSGYVAVLPCSVYGVDVALNALRAFEEAGGVPITTLIGGFNISTFSTYDMRTLLKYATSRGALVIPLHSTSLEAREKICKRVGLEEVPGTGSRFILE